MDLKRVLIVGIVLMMFFAALTPGLNAVAETLPEDAVTDEYVEEVYGLDLSQVDVSEYDEEQFAKEFAFLAEDPVFLQLENELSKPKTETITEKNPFTGEIVERQEIWPAVVVGALRVLLSKVGKSAASKAWNIAKPHVQKALNAPSKYYLDGPKGGRIIQVRLKSTKQPIFRLDYHYIDGKGPYLHYHVAPNMKKHHML